MKKPSGFLAAVFAGFVSIALAQVPAPGGAADPMPRRGNAHFYEMHASFLRRGHQPMELLFIGDSITEWWSRAPAVWRAHYEKYQPANFGIAGDQTQQVIWRIEDGELDGINPKVVVLMLGTNNTARDPAAAIVAANVKIVRLIREKIPGVKVLLLAIFPRGPRLSGGVADPWEERMVVIRDVNAELGKIADGGNVRFLDLTACFLGADGKILDGLMPDRLHPNAAGYQVWAEAMQPLLDEMMK